MIRVVEARRYRCLRHLRQVVDDFQILVGPNGSGKSTFLDVIGLIGDSLSLGLAPAIRHRSPGFLDLVWMEDRQESLEVALELSVPQEGNLLLRPGAERARYELMIGLNHEGLSILREALWLESPDRKIHVISEGKGGTAVFSSETTDWSSPFRFGPQRLALANLPEDEDLFPIATWVKRTLMEGVQRVVLNSEIMRLPSPPGSRYEFQPDGSTLPWAVEELKKDGKIFQRWIEHIRTALPDVETIETIEREEDRHRYLRIVYKNGLKAPSWTISDGTLRLLALTLIGYLKDSGRVYLIEEPENGIHPQAVETVFQSLSSSYGNQILCATHSPVFLAMAEPEQVLCFSRTPKGATEIVRGSEHPNLRDWKRPRLLP